jgi:hypothetical protein
MRTEISLLPKLQTTSMRWLFIGAGVLAGIAGIQLYVLGDHTDQYFAWTIHPPLMAAFLGGAFWAGATGVFLAARQPHWAQARPFLFGATTYTLLILLTTLLHLDRFHLHSSGDARVAALAWLIVYVGLPPVVVVLLWRQVRSPGGESPPETPLSSLARAVLGASAVLTAVVGVGLWLAPSLANRVWLWDLTPLTSQAGGSVLLTLAVSATLVIRESDQRILRNGLVVFVVGAALELTALVRYAGQVHWNRPLAWVYVLALLAMLIGSLAVLSTAQATADARLTS